LVLQRVTPRSVRRTRRVERWMRSDANGRMKTFCSSMSATTGWKRPLARGGPIHSPNGCAPLCTFVPGRDGNEVIRASPEINMAGRGRARQHHLRVRDVV
jgi:hypothetical protein